MNDKLTINNTMRDVISPAATGKDYVHETFVPGFDPHGNQTKIEREEDLEIKGVVLRTSKAPDIDTQIKEASGGKSLDELIGRSDLNPIPVAVDSLRFVMLGDHMSQSDVNKGVVVEAIPDDQLPTDTEGNKADLEVALPCARMVGMSAAFDGDTLSGEDVIVFVVTKPKQPTNHQRHGYSRRKAKRAYQARYKYMMEASAYWKSHQYHIRHLAKQLGIYNGIE